MSEGFNTYPRSTGPEHDLSRALDELIQARAFRKPAPPAGAFGAGSGPELADEGCPHPGAWPDLACGGADKAATDALLAHAAFCPACAVRLRLSLRIFEEEASPEETAELRGLASSSPEWQRGLAARLAATPCQPQTIRTKARLGSRARFALWTGAGLAASLAIAAGATIWWQQAHTPDRLLAETYGESRIFPIRMPGAGFADVVPGTHLRGGATGREPAKLLDARARIAGHLDAAPQDPHWLELEARAEVLEENYDPAIDILDRLLANGPVSAGLLADDAAAYFQRGTASGSENDRATALDYLRRADELAPGDPVVLFNEALAMEDRGQVMNAVETWNRYLRFEHDPRWIAEGRRRLDALEEKLNRMKTHQSRMEQHLATPRAMRALAADRAVLAGLDEELSSTLLPQLLRSGFLLPVDRSRGSPCPDACQAARTLLSALAESLQRNHNDSWLSGFLPSDFSSPNPGFSRAALALGQAIDADVVGDFSAAQQAALESRQSFHRMGNAAGEDRAAVELSYALQRSFHFARCDEEATPLLGRDAEFAWIQIHAITEAGICDTGPGTESGDNPAFERAVSLAQEHRYSLIGFRARSLRGSLASESGDCEDAWRIDMATVRSVYAGDYPPFRISSIMGALAQLEESTPRAHLDLLLWQEEVGILELTGSRELLAPHRLYLAAAAIRAGAVRLAQEEMSKAQSEMAGAGGEKPIQGYLAENEIALANFYIGRRDLSHAAANLDAARDHMAGQDNYVHRRDYAAARGELELALSHPDAAEAALREAIFEEERKAGKDAAESVNFAREDRDVYAALAGVWLAQGRPGEDILALWERYRLRILGETVPACQEQDLICLKPRLEEALARLGEDRVLGQVVLMDRVLFYRADSQGVVWTSSPVGRNDLLAAVAPLERVVSSPASSRESVDQAARRVGEMLFSGEPEASATHGQLLLEPDPLLGNLPWPAVETADGPLGLHFDLEETPSLLLAPVAAVARRGEGHPLVVGASVTSGEGALPEVLNEAREVGRMLKDPSVLLAAQATGARVVSGLETAPVFHFAGHATEHAGVTRLLLAPAGAAGNGAPAPEPGTERPYLDTNLLRKHPPRDARLIVFSACSTGKREEGWNHGMEDIVDTVASLGVPEVVATRWQIDSASAVPMMSAFYGGLAHGRSVSQSLTASRLLVARDARYSHPYYWAAYYASGTGRTDLSEVFHGSSK